MGMSNRPTFQNSNHGGGSVSKNQTNKLCANIKTESEVLTESQKAQPVDVCLKKMVLPGSKVLSGFIVALQLTGAFLCTHFSVSLSLSLSLSLTRHYPLNSPCQTFWVDKWSVCACVRKQTSNFEGSPKLSKRKVWEEMSLTRM